MSPVALGGLSQGWEYERAPPDVEPDTAVLSFLRPERELDADVVMAFCHFVHFFVSPQAARQWTAEHPGSFVLDLDEGFRLGLLHPARPVATTSAGERRSHRID